ncbi:hypothetical protein BH11CYA1_BH11CYA1_04530 [soil metagenome]
MSLNDDMREQLKQGVVPYLRSIGFKGSFPQFRRNHEVGIDVLTFQFDKWGNPSFCVEYGFTSQFVSSSLGTQAPITPKNLTTYDVAMRNRRRLNPQNIESKPNYGDHWYTYSADSPKPCTAQVLIDLSIAIAWWAKMAEEVRATHVIPAVVGNVEYLVEGKLLSSNKVVFKKWLPAIGGSKRITTKPYVLALAALLAVFSTIPLACSAAVLRQHCKLENGSVVIDADKIIDDKEGTTCSAIGSVVVAVPGQDARIQADAIQYDKQTRTVEATGHVRILKKGFEKKGEKLTFVVAKPDPPREVSSMAEPIPGNLIDDRFSLYRCIITAAKAGVNVSPYIPPYEAIEKLVQKNAPSEEVLAKLIEVRFEIGKELGGKELLVEQEYGNGPLSKLCRQAEQLLRADCKFGTGFNDKVFVLCSVNPDGSFSRIATDDPAKYGPAVSALACEKVKSLNLKAPGKDPVPLVISLSNKPELNVVYVSGINCDVYIAYLGSHIKKQWHPTSSKTSKLVRMQLVILRDGTLKTVKVSTTSGVPAADQEAVAAVQRSKPFKPLPDGCCEDLWLEFSLDYNVFNYGASK